MPWELSNDRPIYLQLMERIQMDIVSGKYHAGDKLPSVRDLAIEAAVNPNTMQKALSELERVGLVYSQRTSGRFITEDATMIKELKQHLANEHILEFFEKIETTRFSRRRSFTTYGRENKGGKIDESYFGVQRTYQKLRKLYCIIELKSISGQRTDYRSFRTKRKRKDNIDQTHQRSARSNRWTHIDRRGRTICHHTKYCLLPSGTDILKRLDESKRDCLLFQRLL